MRKTWPTVLMNIAREMSTMGTCIRREVGCVLVDDTNRILSTGMNGVPNRWPHCDPKKSVYEGGGDIDTCHGALTMPPGLSDTPVQGVVCLANHAEANALLGVDSHKVHACYTTTSPCLSCLKLLLCTGCIHIVFLEEYPGHEESAKLWTKYVYVSNSRHAQTQFKSRTWSKYSEGMKLPSEF